MPRQPRLDAPGALHYVIGRGINGVKIFNNRKDREDFLERLSGLCGAVLAYFGKNRRRAIERYESFVEKGISHGRRSELVGGGLILSLGGWSQVLSLRRVGSKVFSDERILGSSDFVKNVIADAEEKTKETLRLSLKISDLPSLAK